MNSKYKSVHGCALFTADYVHSPYLVFVCLFFFFMCDYGFISLLTLNYYICKYSFFLRKASYFARIYLSNRPHFLWVYRCDNPVKRNVGRTREKIVNHSPSTRGFTFLVFSQHPKWVVTSVNPWKVCSIAFIK